MRRCLKFILLFAIVASPIVYDDDFDPVSAIPVLTAIEQASGRVPVAEPYKPAKLLFAKRSADSTASATRRESQQNSLILELNCTRLC